MDLHRHVGLGRFDKPKHVSPVLEAVMQVDVSVASRGRTSTSAHDTEEGVPSPLRREQNANTTGSYGCAPVQMNSPGEVVESVLCLHQRVRAPTIADAHNPKVAGSDPAPATKGPGQTPCLTRAA